MRLRAHEHQQIEEILREELDEANRRIQQRLVELMGRPVANKDETMDGVRRFYQDLTDNDWTDGDEQALGSLGESSEEKIKRLIRDAFRQSRVHPVPSFASLVNVARKGTGASGVEQGTYFNPDAVPAAERERIANLLHRELKEAAGEIASRLKLTDTKADVVREQLEITEGAIISEFTPLV